MATWPGSAEVFYLICKSQHFFIVGALPIYFAAYIAAVKLIIVFSRIRFDNFLDFGFIDGQQTAVAVETAGKESKTARKVESFKDLQKLLLEKLGTDPVSMGDGPVLEKPDIPGKDDPLFRKGDFDDLGVRIDVCIKAVKAEEAQVTGQFSKMDIQNEICFSQGLRP